MAQEPPNNVRTLVSWLVRYDYVIDVHLNVSVDRVSSSAALSATKTPLLRMRNASVVCRISDLVALQDCESGLRNLRVMRTSGTNDCTTFD